MSVSSEWQQMAAGSPHGLPGWSHLPIPFLPFFSVPVIHPSLQTARPARCYPGCWEVSSGTEAGRLGSGGHASRPSPGRAPPSRPAQTAWLPGCCPCALGYLISPPPTPRALLCLALQTSGLPGSWPHRGRWADLGEGAAQHLEGSSCSRGVGGSQEGPCQRCWRSGYRGRRSAMWDVPWAGAAGSESGRGRAAR